jgi:hypothetical protein
VNTRGPRYASTVRFPALIDAGFGGMLRFTTVSPKESVYPNAGL